MFKRPFHKQIPGLWIKPNVWTFGNEAKHQRRFLDDLAGCFFREGGLLSQSEPSRAISAPFIPRMPEIRSDFERKVLKTTTWTSFYILHLPTLSKMCWIGRSCCSSAATENNPGECLSLIRRSSSAKEYLFVYFDMMKDILKMFEERRKHKHFSFRWKTFKSVWLLSSFTWQSWRFIYLKCLRSACKRSGILAPGSCLFTFNELFRVDWWSTWVL